MSVSYIKIFNQVVDEFFKELIEIFPEENKIKVNYNLFQTLCKANAKKPCNDFLLACIPYLEMISMKDDAFFISKNKPAWLGSMNIEKLWPELSDNTKEAIWNYIKSFFTIGINIVEMPEECMGLVNYIITN